MKLTKTLQLNFKRSGHIPELDGIRGLAIFLVLVNHFFKFYPFQSISEFGWIGVDLFFVLSGFLITGILIETKCKSHFLKNFYIRRFIRIFPLYYLVLIILFFILPYLLTLPKEYEYFLSRKEFYFLYIHNNLFFFDGWPVNDMLSHLWSLGIEEQFYMFWPIIVYLVNENRILLIAFLLVCLNIFIRIIFPNELIAYFSSFTRFDGLLIGGMLAIAIRKYPYFVERNILYVFLSSLFLIVFALYESGWKFSINNYYFMRWGYTVLAIFWGCIIIFCFATNVYFKPLIKVFSLKPLRFLGKISYGIYIYHMLIFGLLGNLIAGYLKDAGIVVNNNYDICVVSVVMLITILLSYLSFRFFETPILSLKNRFK